MEDFLERKGGSVQDQAVAFRRPRLFPLTAIHERQPEQGLFYREDGRAFLRLWMKNACDLEREKENLFFWRWSGMYGR